MKMRRFQVSDQIYCNSTLYNYTDLKRSTNMNTAGELQSFKFHDICQHGIYSKPGMFQNCILCCDGVNHALKIVILIMLISGHAYNESQQDQGCHQLNLIAGKVNREMALNQHHEDQRESRNDENHSNHLFLHVELQ